MKRSSIIAAAALLVGAGLALRLRKRRRCCCQTSHPGPETAVLDAFERVRQGCPALRDVLLPDTIWPQVRAQAAAPPAGVGHRSHLFYAFERGHLASVTEPIHRFLLSGRAVREDVSQQYRNDLRERWMLKPTEAERQDRFKSYYGKVVELQVANWLARRGWTVTGLEARGAPADIQAYRCLSRLHSFEVKYLGEMREVFALVVRSLVAGRPIADALPVYAPPNYLLLRVYEAAKRLDRVRRPRIATIVVDERSWHNLVFPLQNRWIDWAAPSFMGNERGWQQFFSSEILPRFPRITEELAEVVRKLDAVWILRLHPEYRFRFEQKIIMPRP
jgi:hypothetical protein